MGESGIRKYGSIWWELGRISENRNGYCENAFSNAAGSREVSQQKHGSATQKFLSFPGTTRWYLDP